jgi:hypothetical protein
MEKVGAGTFCSNFTKTYYYSFKIGSLTLLTVTSVVRKLSPWTHDCQLKVVSTLQILFAVNTEYEEEIHYSSVGQGSPECEWNSMFMHAVSATYVLNRFDVQQEQH